MGIEELINVITNSSISVVMLVCMMYYINNTQKENNKVVSEMVNKMGGFIDAMNDIKSTMIEMNKTLVDLSYRVEQIEKNK